MRADIGSKTEAVWKQLLDASSSRNERRNAWWEILGMIDRVLDVVWVTVMKKAADPRPALARTFSPPSWYKGQSALS